MVSTAQIFVLAIVQGITEFLPISSSGHLNLVHLLTVWSDEGALIDVAIHVGSLFAVMIYFWRDMVMLLGGLFDLARARWTKEARLLAFLIAASVPVFIVGYIVLASGLIDTVRTLGVIAVANLIFAILLYASDRLPAMHGMGHVDLRQALIVGAAQILSLVPGVSRSGITMTAARFLGISRTEAARFSMLLAIPTILGAGAASGYEIYKTGDLVLQQDALLACALSFVTALVSIWGLMAWLKHMSFTPFVVYRIALSAVLFAVLALG